MGMGLFRFDKGRSFVVKLGVKRLATRCVTELDQFFHRIHIVPDQQGSVAREILKIIESSSVPCPYSD